ncbi:hypothetical protein AAMO2058_000970800 [Amorphochlora amoebiformis]
MAANEAGKIDEHTSEYNKLRWKVISRKELSIHHAPSSTSDTNGFLVPQEMVTAFEKKGQWIRHSRGWTLTLMKKSSLMVQITSEDEELDFLIYKFTGLRDEVRFTTKRLKELIDARKEYRKTAAQFARTLAIMGSHSKAPVGAVQSVQKFFMTEGKLKEEDEKPDVSLVKELARSLGTQRQNRSSRCFYNVSHRRRSSHRHSYGREGSRTLYSSATKDSQAQG